ncbi:MAG: hypothetical protein AAF849_02480 [Bacteroidota bacterium]
MQKYGSKAHGVERNSTRDGNANRFISLNEAIGTLQSGYDSAINREHQWLGRLFEDNCKAKDDWIDEFVALQKKGVMRINAFTISTKTQ